MSDGRSRLRKTKFPCSVCGINQVRCICAVIPRLDLRTRVSLIVHAKELKRTTNSGKLAVASLVNSQMWVRGVKGAPLDLATLIQPGECPLLFYPSDDSVELTPEFVAGINRPIHLIVPDGNWRQAAKVPSREPVLISIPRVRIGRVNTAVHHLRKEHRAEGMSTLEAIAYALSVIEGREAVQDLFTLYQAKLQQTLLGRGIAVAPLGSSL